MVEIFGKMALRDFLMELKCLVPGPCTRPYPRMAIIHLWAGSTKVQLYHTPQSRTTLSKLSSGHEGGQYDGDQI